MPYKGKSTTRGWATLPPDIIRLILTHFLLDFSASAFLPQTWAQRDHWLGRLVYNVIRDTEAIEKVMSVCPTWGIASAYNILLSSYVLLLYIIVVILPRFCCLNCFPFSGELAFLGGGWSYMRLEYIAITVCVPGRCFRARAYALRKGFKFV